MSFIIVMIAWGLVQHWGSGTPIQHNDWFDEWYERVRGGVKQPGAVVVITLLLPCLALVLLADWFEHVLFGLLYITLGVLTLLYSFGRGDFGELVAGFTQRWRRSEFEGAYLYAAELMGIDRAETDTVEEPRWFWLKLIEKFSIGVMNAGLRSYFIFFWLDSPGRLPIDWCTCCRLVPSQLRSVKPRPSF